MSNRTGGLAQVSINDLILVFAFAPIAGLLLVIGLLLTVVLLFGFQAETIVDQPKPLTSR